MESMRHAQRAIVALRTSGHCRPATYLRQVVTRFPRRDVSFSGDHRVARSRAAAPVSRLFSGVATAVKRHGCAPEQSVTSDTKKRTATGIPNGFSQKKPAQQ